MTDAPEIPAAGDVALPPSDPAPEEPVNLEVEIPEADVNVEVDEPIEPQEPDEDFEEFEWDGKPIRGPKGLKDGVLMHADYTKKTQEVAEKRREVEAYEARIRDQAKATDEDLAIRAEFVSKAKELEQYRNGDWDTYWDQQPVEAGKAHARWQSLERELNGLALKIQQRTNERNSTAQQEHAKRLSDTLEHARKNIKGWTPEIDQKIGDFVRSKGVADNDLQAVLNPQVYEILHLAYLGHQALTKPVTPKPPPTPVPLTVVAAKAAPPARKDPGEMNMDEYAAWRAKGGGGGRRY